MIKSLTFRFATRAGITISKNDIVIPDDKEEILARFEDEVSKVGREYDRGLMTEEERDERIVAIWTEATEVVANAMMANLSPTNPIYMMANSGARGSFNQIRQLAGMRGLMADPKGEIIARPIKANFMEGLTVLEYFISTHGARKGLADTALRTADSGYLTRRLVDVSQDVIIRDQPGKNPSDCGTKEYVDLALILDESPNKSVAGRVAALDIMKPIKDGKPGKVLVIAKGEEITMSGLRKLVEEFGEHADTATIPVRSVLKCRAEYGLCRLCYGTFLATGGPAEIGDAVGIIAAQSIGEPGTQLTMRTFHTGGVAGADITHGLPRVVEIFEARNPKGAGTLTDVAGKVDVDDSERTIKVTITPTAIDEKGELPDPKEYAFPRRTRLKVATGQLVESGDALNEGSLNPTDLLTLKGATATELYLVGEVQNVYKSQGVEIHDKHIELIVRQMLKKVRVESAGDTALLPGQLVDRVVLERENAAREEGEGRAGDLRADHPRHHEGVARDRVLPLGGLVPGDHQGAHGRGHRGQDRSPARAEGERDHRQAHPRRDRAQAVPADLDRADRAASGDVRTTGGGGGAPGRARGDRRGRRVRSRRARPPVRRGPSGGRRRRRRRARDPRRRGVAARGNPWFPREPPPSEQRSSSRRQASRPAKPASGPTDARNESGAPRPTAYDLSTLTCSSRLSATSSRRETASRRSSLSARHPRCPRRLCFGAA